MFFDSFLSLSTLKITEILLFTTFTILFSVPKSPSPYFRKLGNFFLSCVFWTKSRYSLFNIFPDFLFNFASITVILNESQAQEYRAGEGCSMQDASFTLLFLSTYLIPATFLLSFFRGCTFHALKFAASWKPGKVVHFFDAREVFVRIHPLTNAAHFPTSDFQRVLPQSFLSFTPSSNWNFCSLIILFFEVIVYSIPSYICFLVSKWDEMTVLVIVSKQNLDRC